MPYGVTEPTVTGDTFLAMMEYTSLCHIPVETEYKFFR
jgi:hypothetical protein